MRVEPAGGALPSEGEPGAAAHLVEQSAESAEEGGDEAKKGRLSALHLAVLGVVAVALVVGVSAWWMLSRQAGGGRGSGVPRDAVALINSSTPIVPVRSKRVADSVGDLAAPPESERWGEALREAHRAREEGRYSSAISQYSALVGSGSAQEAADALWGLASAYAESGQRELAIRAYSLFSDLDDPRAVRALVRMGQLEEQGGDSEAAIKLYGEYADLGGPARDAVKIRQARLMGNTADAERIYREVLDGRPSDVDRRQALIGLAGVKMARGEHAEARRLYDQLAAVRREEPRSVLDNEGVPAEVLAAGESVLLLDAGGARKRLLDYIEVGCRGIPAPCHEYPHGRQLALSALLKLDSRAVVSGTVHPMLAAEVAYNAGRYGDVVGHLDTLRAASSDPGERAAASLLTGKAFEFSSAPAAAYNWYTATVQTYPTSPQAAEAIRRAGDALEEQGAWDAALATYKDAIERYPGGGEEAALARIHGGVLAYRLEQPDVALSWLSPVLSMPGISDALRAEAAFWVGKLQRRKGDLAWKGTLGQVTQLDSGSYLDFQARAVVGGETDAGPLVRTFGESGVEQSSFGARHSQEESARRELMDWAARLPAAREVVSGTVSATPSGTPSVHQSSVVEEDVEAQRAMALWSLGLEEEGFQAFRALAERLQESGDGPALARLVAYVRYHTDARTAMRVAERLAMLDDGDPLKRPRLLLKTLYPTPYGGLVAEEAKARDVDPLVMYALMRQESEFVPGARSHADARGLAQVIPSTGGDIASRLGDDAFSADDLYLPYVSVRYGTYYLAANLPQFERRLIPALAAYNGGPGNAARWMAGSALIDADLYGERIDLFETDDYVRRVYQNYGFYRIAYSP